MVKTPIMVRSEGGAQRAGAHNTNLLHLPRFAPRVKLAPEQVFKVRVCGGGMGSRCVCGAGPKGASDGWESDTGACPAYTCADQLHL